MSIFEESMSYRPFKYPQLVAMTKKHQIDLHWHENQIELQDDLRQYNAIGGLETPNVSHEVNKFILDSNLCLFTELDKTVAGGYTKLLPFVHNNEARNWFITAASREVIHQRAYALAAETFGFEEGDWIAFRDYKEMQEKIDVMEGKGVVEDLSKPEVFAVALARLLLGEGIGLFAAFSVLLNFKRFGLLMGTNIINEWSLRDENEHVEGNIIILKDILKGLDPAILEVVIDTIKVLVRKFVDAEHAYIDLLFAKGAPEDLTKKDLKGYMEYLGELRLVQMGLGVTLRENPIPWMEEVLVGKKHTNFFEAKVTDYTHAGLSGDVKYTAYKY